jgi:hypothetical protein
MLFRHSLFLPYVTKEGKREISEPNTKSFSEKGGEEKETHNGLKKNCK